MTVLQLSSTISSRKYTSTISSHDILEIIRLIKHSERRKRSSTLINCHDKQLKYVCNFQFKTDRTNYNYIKANMDILPNFPKMNELWI